MCLMSTLHIIYRRQHLRLRPPIQPLAKHGVFAMFAATLELAGDQQPDSGCVGSFLQPSLYLEALGVHAIAAFPHSLVFLSKSFTARCTRAPGSGLTALGAKEQIRAPLVIALHPEIFHL
jgi:hypothetical protein